MREKINRYTKKKYIYIYILQGKSEIDVEEKKDIRGKKIRYTV